MMIKSVAISFGMIVGIVVMVWAGAVWPQVQSEDAFALLPAEGSGTSAVSTRVLEGREYPGCFSFSDLIDKWTSLIGKKVFGEAALYTDGGCPCLMEAPVPLGFSQGQHFFGRFKNGSFFPLEEPPEPSPGGGLFFSAFRWFIYSNVQLAERYIFLFRIDYEQKNEIRK